MAGDSAGGDEAATTDNAQPGDGMGDYGGPADTPGDAVYHGPAVGLTIDPGQATLTIQDGEATPVTFHAILSFAHLSTAETTATWSCDRLDLVQVDGAGVVTATGLRGGVGVLTATTPDFSATAAVTVLLRFVQNSAALTPPQMTAFDVPDGDSSGTLLYPYDGTVFPRGLTAPELLWSCGDATDVYRIRLTVNYGEATFYASAPSPSRFPIPQSVWQQLSESTTGEALRVSISCLVGSQAHAAMPRTLPIAQGSLRGAINCWSIGTGLPLKLSLGTDAAVPAFDPGPADVLGNPAPASYNGTVPPWDTGGNNRRCVACHTVSRDGSTLAGVFERKGSTASPWGTVDLTQIPPTITQVAPYTSTAIFVALSPDGAFAVYNNVDLTLHLAAAPTGVSVASVLDSFADDVAANVGELALAAASGRALETRNQQISYSPSVCPIAVDGYFWVVFVSPRDYGNRMVSVSSPTYESRKQLWVAAIDANPSPGSDPSHPAFWLPGQDLSTINHLFASAWSQEGCRAEGAGCSEGFECCTGFCRGDPASPVCVPAPTDCSRIGERCRSVATCCAGSNVGCLGRVCFYSSPP